MGKNKLLEGLLPKKASYNSCAFFGSQGSGKTLSMIKLGINLACRYRRGLVSNLRLNVAGFYDYSIKYNLDWLKRCCDENLIVSLPSNDDIELIFRYPFSIVMFDEAGIQLNNRNWEKNSNLILTQCNQLRKNFCTFLWTAQYASMSDKVLRATVELCAYCQGHSYFDYRRQKDILKKVDTRFFSSDAFWTWIDDPVMKLKPVSTMLKTRDRWSGPVSSKELMLFNCYNSHDTIGGNQPLPLKPIHTVYKSNLPKNYYLSRLETGLDPINRLSVQTIYPEYSIESLTMYYFEGFPLPAPTKIYHKLPSDFIFESDRPLPIFQAKKKERYSKGKNVVNIYQ
jgi:hypothetical protein